MSAQHGRYWVIQSLPTANVLRQLLWAQGIVCVVFGLEEVTMSAITGQGLLERATRVATSGVLTSVSVLSSAMVAGLAAFIALHVATVVCWLLWHYRTARAAAEYAPRINPRLHLASWAVPGLNAVMPFYLVARLRAVFTARTTTATIVTWWVASVITVTAAAVAATPNPGTFATDATVVAIVDAPYWAGAAGIAAAIAALCAQRIVGAIASAATIVGGRNPRQAAMPVRRETPDATGDAETTVIIADDPTDDAEYELLVDDDSLSMVAQDEAEEYHEAPRIRAVRGKD